MKRLERNYPFPWRPYFVPGLFNCRENSKRIKNKIKRKKETRVELLTRFLASILFDRRSLKDKLNAIIIITENTLIYKWQLHWHFFFFFFLQTSHSNKSVVHDPTDRLEANWDALCQSFSFDLSAFRSPGRVEFSEFIFEVRAWGRGRRGNGRERERGERLKTPLLISIKTFKRDFILVLSFM